MKCAAFHKMIGDRLDGTIRPADRARLDAHLGACAECRELLDDFQRIAESARTLDDQDAPSDDVWNAILSGVRAARREERRAASRGFRGFAVPRWAYVAGFVLLVAAAGLVVGLGPWRGTAVPGLTPEQAATVAKLEESEMHYKLAIQALTEALGAGRDRIIGRRPLRPRPGGGGCGHPGLPRSRRARARQRRCPRLPAGRLPEEGRDPRRGHASSETNAVSGQDRGESLEIEN
jgi:hypothetical protein